jgi:hypothetical protein
MGRIEANLEACEIHSSMSNFLGIKSKLLGVLRGKSDD